MTDLEKLLAEATPGPWVYDSEDQGGAWGVNFSIQQAENRLVDVAEMVSDEANSRLIALAPQLAAALIKAEEALAAATKTLDLLDCDDDAAFCRVALAEIRALTGGGE